MKDLINWTTWHCPLFFPFPSKDDLLFNSFFFKHFISSKCSKFLKSNKRRHIYNPPAVAQKSVANGIGPPSRAKEKKNMKVKNLVVDEEKRDSERCGAVLILLKQPPHLCTRWFFCCINCFFIVFSTEWVHHHLPYGRRLTVVLSSCCP